MERSVAATIATAMVATDLAEVAVGHLVPLSATNVVSVVILRAIVTAVDVTIVIVVEKEDVIVVRGPDRVIAAVTVIVVTDQGTEAVRETEAARKDAVAETEVESVAIARREVAVTVVIEAETEAEIDAINPEKRESQNPGARLNTAVDREAGLVRPRPALEHPDLDREHPITTRIVTMITTVATMMPAIMETITETVTSTIAMITMLAWNK